MCGEENQWCRSPKKKKKKRGGGKTKTKRERKRKEKENWRKERGKGKEGCWLGEEKVSYLVKSREKQNKKKRWKREWFGKEGGKETDLVLNLLNFFRQFSIFFLALFGGSRRGSRKISPPHQLLP